MPSWLACLESSYHFVNCLNGRAPVAGNGGWFLTISLVGTESCQQPHEFGSDLCSAGPSSETPFLVCTLPLQLLEIPKQRTQLNLCPDSLTPRNCEIISMCCSYRALKLGKETCAVIQLTIEFATCHAQNAWHSVIRMCMQDPVYFSRQPWGSEQLLSYYFTCEQILRGVKWLVQDHPSGGRA